MFSGEIHNGSESWTIREVTIRLTLKEKPVLDLEELEKKYGATVVPPPPGVQPYGVLTAIPQMKSREYRIRNLWIQPLETGHVSVEVLSPPGSEFVQWKVTAANGFKTYWNRILNVREASPGPSSAAKPSRVPPEGVLSEVSPNAAAPGRKSVSNAAKQALQSLPFGFTLLPDDSKQQALQRAEQGSEWDVVPRGTAEPPEASKQSAVSAQVSIVDAENSGLVRTSYRNPSGSSSGDSVLLIVVKTGGSDGLVLTVPPGLLLKSPLPSVQNMIVAGLKGRDVGGGKYTPANTITLTGSQPSRYVIEAYCAEFHKDNPPADRFDFEVGTSVDPRTVCVLNEARRQGLSVAGTQAAVWIQLDHVTFSEMNERMPVGITEWSRAEAVVSGCTTK